MDWSALVNHHNGVVDFSTRRLYLCTPDRPDLEDFLRAVLDGGVDVVQLRDKHADAATILDRAARCQAICAEFGVPFIVNDRPDLALHLGADGVHVGQDDAPVALCRRILGPNAIVGLSTHALAELDGALSQEVTYLSAGPIEETPTKPGRPGTGIAYAAHATAVASVPVFVTGGVTPERIGPLVDAGLSHFVVVRSLTEATKPGTVAGELRSAIDRYL